MTEYEAFKLLKKCSVRRPNDMPSIDKCIAEAIKEGAFPTRIFVEEIKGDDKHVAIMYSVPKEELVKDMVKREDYFEEMVEGVIDRNYTRMGDKFYNEEPIERKELKEWGIKII